MRVAYLDVARVELEEAAVWYEARQEGLGERFLATIAATEKLLDTSPSSGTAIAVLSGRRVVRRALVLGFPYALIYVQRARTLWILAVAHLHRRPGYWRRRRPL